MLARLVKRKSKNNKKEAPLRFGNNTLYHFLKESNKKEALHECIGLASLRPPKKEENLISGQKFLPVFSLFNKNKLPAFQKWTRENSKKEIITPPRQPFPLSYISEYSPI